MASAPVDPKLAAAAEAVAKINERILPARREQPSRRESFSATLAINDLTVPARVAATSPRIAESAAAAGAAITRKGQFYAAGSGPEKKGDLPKLYLLVEGAEKADVVAGMQIVEAAVKEKEEGELVWETTWAGRMVLGRAMVLPMRM